MCSIYDIVLTRVYMHLLELRGLSVMFDVQWNIVNPDSGNPKKNQSGHKSQRTNLYSDYNVLLFMQNIVKIDITIDTILAY